MGVNRVRQSKKCFLGELSKIYLSCYNLFLQFLIYTVEEMNDLETVVSCGALERSNNLNIKRITELNIFQNQKEIVAMWV